MPKCNHVPDITTMYVEYDGGSCYLDVKCKLCGLDGCIAEIFVSDDRTVNLLGPLPGLVSMPPDLVFDDDHELTGNVWPLFHATSYHTKAEQTDLID